MKLCNTTSVQWTIQYFFSIALTGELLEQQFFSHYWIHNECDFVVTFYTFSLSFIICSPFTDPHKCSRSSMEWLCINIGSRFILFLFYFCLQLTYFRNHLIFTMHTPSVNTPSTQFLYSHNWRNNTHLLYTNIKKKIS